ncbi:ribonuclease III [Tepidimicrobium xylanilyticum]|uniref:Ribonuclease 3 n=1 Tax=Tepidimicrobium xylanilyticum TaxID=1123352 RepID=A0A1H2YN85_9FIRM|nr:ribonuclease III [Tepidimicrobium xylanilyticum]GMG97169.1 ribonuclease 3 [Tepidimicrobium xylanilyticum]SDX06693.1 RNAse III [Tepidimicrobium xylanilyticum]
MRISPDRERILNKLQSEINYQFKDIELLNTSLTHSSYVNENKGKCDKSNERLEFLGDSVISLVVSEYLYKRFIEFPEGDLTKRRASVVCESSLAFAARKINLGDYLLLGKGEDATGGRDRDSILADAFEALTGAIFVDGGLKSAKDFLLGQFEREVIYALSKGNLFIDYKTELQEILQKRGISKIEYRVEKETGPDHNKKFYMNVLIEGKIIGSGMGRNKKEAEQMAAKQALLKIGETDG